jgi:hypothetical protein
MQKYVTPGLATVDDPWKETHNTAATKETIKQLLADGTPDWVKHPHDYKNFVNEAFQAEKENSDKQVEGYKMEDQSLLTDEAARLVNVISTRNFIRKLRDNGVKCFTIDNGWPGTVALWVVQNDKPVYICYLQAPAMVEWSVLALDKHGLPAGESYRGWRTVLVQLIEKFILTEDQAHKIFGAPTINIVSKRYRQTLYNFRNGKRLVPEKEVQE